MVNKVQRSIRKVEMTEIEMVILQSWNDGRMLL